MINNSAHKNKPEKTKLEEAKKVIFFIAPFWKKIAAWIYDSLAALAVFILASVVGHLILYLITIPWLDNTPIATEQLTPSPLSQELNSNPLWGIYLVLCMQYYYVYCWVKGGQTVGMRAWHLKVCEKDGQFLNWKKAYLRSFASLGGIAHLWSLIDNNKRGWHDIAVGSYVVVLPQTTTNQKPIL